MKRFLLLTLLVTAAVMTNAQTYPIFGQFSLGMDGATVSERLDTMKVHNQVKREKYGLELTYYEFKLGGNPFSIDNLSFTELDSYWYNSIKKE